MLHTIEDFGNFAVVKLNICEKDSIIRVFLVTIIIVSKLYYLYINSIQELPQFLPLSLNKVSVLSFYYCYDYLTNSFMSLLLNCPASTCA